MLSKGAPNHPYIPSCLHFNMAGLVVVWLAQSLLLLSSSQTAGVTHWKLIDNEIMPEQQNLDTPGEAQRDEDSKQDSGIYPISQGQLSTSDPEFSMLVRYSTRNSGGGTGSLNRGAGGMVFTRDKEPPCLIRSALLVILKRGYRNVQGLQRMGGKSGSLGTLMDQVPCEWMG